MKKYLTIMILLVTFLNLGITVFATDSECPKISDDIITIVDEYRPVDTYGIISDVGTISVKKQIIFQNNNYDLYCTFDDPNKAIYEISNLVPNLINLLKAKYSLEELSNNTWKDYYNAMYELFDDNECPEWYTESNIEFRRLSSFFDIYENEEKNLEILSYCDTSYMTASTDLEDMKTNLFYALPYSSVEKSPFIYQIDLTSIEKGFDTSKGIAYAEKWATSKNTDEYYYFSHGDCANFTSQILENGGVAQEVYDDEAKGWWHTVTSHWYGNTHKHSQAWSFADVFSRYMGVNYTTTSNSSFSSNIKAGDFIATDKTNDGDWDHMGFVTEVKSTQTNGYYDYKVAQHTSDYLAWASSKDNGWDNIGNDGGKYGRVRR